MAIIVRTLLLILCLFLLQACSDRKMSEQEQAKRWHFHFEEIQIQSFQNHLSNEYKSESLASVNANLISMKDGEILSNQTVLVKNGAIIAAGQNGDVPVSSEFRKVDCTGLYLMPGLTDMHVHNLVSSSQHLLNLANGITSVRDMDGFPWMLKMRNQIKENKLLAPNMYVAGHILNDRPMGMYATVVTSAEQGRQAVREQKAAGYDFIKIHNSMKFEIYSAVLDEAKKHNVDAVGHIPHFITIKQAAEHGQKTFEHFKGYILDNRLVLTDEDFVQASKNISNWNCPTFYTHRGNMHGEEALKLVAESPDMKYASWRDKKDWLEGAQKHLDDNQRLQQNIYPLSIKIFKDLLPVYNKFLAGTDSGGGYPFHVPGFALHEELRIMNANGLDSFQTLQAATLNPAKAMNRENEFGTVQVGKRADLLLLRANPLKDISNLQQIEGVAVRGIWMARKDLDQILAEIERIYNPLQEKQIIQYPIQNQIDSFMKSFNDLKSQGFVFRSHDVEEINKLLGK
jgi:imidazolonepropionase-like amidohydrolase